jgi:two-component system sensor histidine kinase/response regulator
MQNTGKIRILIIDDEADFRENLRILLMLEGYAAQVAEDAIEGGKALLAEKPDLIISDINMPYMDGLELLSLLRSNEDTKSTPVILVSARSDIDTLGQASQLGASDFLIKPLSRERLLSSIRACLKTAADRPPHGSGKY